MISKKILMILALSGVTFSSAYTFSELEIIPSFFLATTETGSITSEDVTTEVAPTFESASKTSSSLTSIETTESIESSSQSTVAPATKTSQSISASPFTSTTTTQTMDKPTNTFKAFTVVSVSPDTFTLSGTSSGLVTETTKESVRSTPSVFSLSGTSSGIKSEPVVTKTSITPDTFTLSWSTLKTGQKSVSDSEPEFIFDADSDNTEIVIESTSTTLSKITITEEISNPKLSFKNLLTTTVEGKKAITYPNILEMNTSTSQLDVKIVMPAGIKISGKSDWDGVINLPTYKDTRTVNSGTDVVTSVIEVGLDDTELTFDKPVRIVFDGKAGENASFQRSGVNTKITTVCNGDSENTVTTQLRGSGECAISSGGDLVVWTYHFTKFFTSSSSSGGGNGSMGGGNRDKTPPSFPTTFDNNTFPFSINDKKYAISEIDNIQPISIETGNPVYLQIQVYDNKGPQNIQQVTLYLNQHGNRILNDFSATSITFEKGKDVEITDPNKLIQSATLVPSIFGKKAVFDFEIVFSKEMDTSDLIFRIWDSKRNSVDMYIPKSLTVFFAETVPEEEIDSEPIFSWDVFNQWAGFSESVKNDEEFLNHLGFEGKKIPDWIKMHNSKWLKEKKISQQDFIRGISYLVENGIIRAQ